MYGAFAKCKNLKLEQRDKARPIQGKKIWGNMVYKASMVNSSKQKDWDVPMS